MFNPYKLLLLFSIPGYVLFCSCSKEDQTTEKILAANTRSNVPDPNNGSADYTLEFSWDCRYIGNRHPDSGYSTLTGSLECYNKKPKWWPDFNQKIEYPTWVWQHAGGYDPNARKKLLLELPPGEVYSLPRTNKDEIYALLESRVLQSFPLRPNRNTPISVADLGLTPDEVLFLDNYFAERILLMDGLRSNHPNNSLLSLDDEVLIQVYMILKSNVQLVASPNDPPAFPANFFGEDNIDHLSRFLFTDYSNYGFYINWNVPQYWTYKTTQISSAFGSPIPFGKKLHVILPKYYLYLMIDPVSIPNDFLFVD